MKTLDQRMTNPSGGWWWHVRAWRSRKSWQPVTQQMQDWWLHHSPQADKLVIVGASAGWMLSTQWLCRFKEVLTVDIDPWAWRLFNWQHGRALQDAGVQLVHRVADAFSPEFDWFDGNAQIGRAHV